MTRTLKPSAAVTPTRMKLANCSTRVAAAVSNICDWPREMTSPSRNPNNQPSRAQRVRGHFIWVVSIHPSPPNSGRGYCGMGHPLYVPVAFRVVAALVHTIHVSVVIGTRLVHPLCHCPREHRCICALRAEDITMRNDFVPTVPILGMCLFCSGGGFVVLVVSFTQF